MPFCRRLARLMSLVAMMVAAASAAQAQGKRVALLIANKDYKPGVGALVNPLNDIRVVGDALKSIGFEVLPPVTNATRDITLLAVQDFAAKLRDAGSDAVGFLYYSGHGVSSGSDNFMIPVDVDEPSTRWLSVRGVKQTEVLAILRGEAPNAAHYIVLDACRNNLQGARGGKGFVPIGQQSGVLFAFSAEPGKTATDAGDGSGPYAAALAAELKKPGQSDLFMFHRVRISVIEKTGGDQVPWIEDGIRRRDRVMFGGPAPPSKPAMSEAALAWSSIQNSTSPAVLDAFAKRHAGSTFADMAEARIRELKASQVTAVVPPQKSLEPASKSVTSKPAPTTATRAERCVGVMVDVAGSGPTCIKPGSGKTTWFKDCSACPEMVVVPAGSFTMGSPPAERVSRQDYGEDQIRITIPAPFAVGRFAVTFDEWEACVAEGDCNGYRPKDEEWGRGRRPVINVNWNDAKAYAAWLSKKTGKSYRLLSESEREYVTRAGTSTPFWWGSSISTEQANYNGQFAYRGGAKGEYRGKTVPVDMFEANPWGLYNVHGNVSEWAEDCYDATSNSTNPGGGRSRGGDAGCSRVLRGGKFGHGPESLRSAQRGFGGQGDRDKGIGFRLARTLSSTP